MSLDALLQNNRLWRGTGDTRQIPVLPTGFEDLDEQLPGGGWPDSGLVELLPRDTGIGELRLLMPALARLSREARWIAWIAPPHLPYAPALASAGVDLSRVLMVHPRNAQDGLWALEQALRAGTCSAVLAWPENLHHRAMRRLQLAAETGRSIAFLFRRDQSSQVSTAQLRLRLDSHSQVDHANDAPRLNVDILKCRGGWPAGPVTLAVPVTGAATCR